MRKGKRCGLKAVETQKELGSGDASSSVLNLECMLPILSSSRSSRDSDMSINYCMGEDRCTDPGLAQWTVRWRLERASLCRLAGSEAASTKEALSGNGERASCLTPWKSCWISVAGKLRKRQGERDQSGGWGGGLRPTRVGYELSWGMQMACRETGRLLFSWGPSVDTAWFSPVCLTWYVQVQR